MFFSGESNNDSVCFTNSGISQCTALTLWNKPLGLSSQDRKSQITKLERNIIQLTPRVRSIIVGILLSDGWMNKYGHWNPRLALKQSIKNFPYLWETYNELAYLCSGHLYQSKNKLRNKTFYSWTLQTRQLPCLIEIFNLFYRVDKRKNIKTVKSDLYFYLDYIALAHWIQGDGSWHHGGVYLATNSFTLKEVVLLVNILIIKFDIKPTIQSRKFRWDSKIYKSSKVNESIMRYVIKINRKDLEKIKPELLPYISDHFLYKISPKGLKR